MKPSFESSSGAPLQKEAGVVRIPSLMNARYRSRGQAQLPNYLKIEDIILKKGHLGRLLPQNEPRREVLDFWVRHTHPAFATVYRYLDWDGQYLAILPELADFRRLSESCATKIKISAIAKVFLNLVSGCRWLHQEALRHPQFNLDHILIRENGEVSILGHESANGFSGALEAEMVPHVDIRYAAPEVMSRQVPGEKSDVFQLGAIFHHFLTGRPFLRNGAYAGVRQSNRRLKKSWDSLLGSMLSLDPSDRPDWDTVWEIARETLLDDPQIWARSCPSWQPERTGPWDEKLEKALGEAEQGPRMISMMMDSGRMGRMRLDRFARKAEKKEFLVVHTWRDDPVPRAYESINEIIALVKLGFLAHIDRPDLDQAFLPLSEWQSADDLKKRWRQTLTHLVNSMVPGLYRGIVLILENFHHMDPVSLETLITFSAWMAPTPFLLVLTGPSPAHPHFRQFREQWEYPEDQVSLPAPSAASVARWHRIHRCLDLNAEQIETVLDQVGHREIYFLQWLKDQEPRGALWHWMTQIWSWLKPKEQLVLKMLGCSVRPLSVAEMAEAFGLNQLAKHVNNLVEFDLVGSSESGFCLNQSVWADWMSAELRRADRQHSLKHLLAFEQQQTEVDPVQIAFLATELGQSDLVEHALNPVLPSFLASWDSRDVRRLGQLHQQLGSDRFAPYAAVAAFLNWQKLPGQEVELQHPALSLATKAQRFLAQGNAASAQKTLHQLLGKRQLPAGLKAWTMMMLAERAAEAKDDLAVAKIWRQWSSFDKSQMNPAETDVFTARLAGSMVTLGRDSRNLSVAVAGLPRHLRLWIEAIRAWQAGLFDEASQSYALLLDHLPRETDPIWLGRIHQQRGNALYRQYRPAEAIRCYEEARRYFARAHFQEGIDNISFNLASSEKLAGRFAASVARFHPILQRAEKEQDVSTQSQIMFNLMVCALYQNDIKLFDRWASAHQKLTRNGSDPTESIRRMTTWLQTALLRSKDEVLEALEQLEKLLRKATPDLVLAGEVTFAQRWGRFALGEDAPSPGQPYPELVSWRHQLIDALQGLDGPRFPGLTQTMGRGFLGACHFFLLSTVISRHLIPENYLDKALLRAFHQHIQSSGANFSHFIRQYFGHLRGLGDIPPEAWRRAMQVLSTVEWREKDPSAFESRLVTALHATWPFSDRGSCQLLKGRWYPLQNGHSHPLDTCVGDHLNILQIGQDTDPLTTQFAHPEKMEVRPMLLLPLKNADGKQAMLWFLAPEKHENIGMRLDLLFRFYAKLFEWVFQTKNEVQRPEVTSQPGSRSGLTKNLGMVGRSGRMLEVKEKILQYAPSNLNLFVYGESGTGKELAATAIHNQSNRRHMPFRAVNCAHYPDNLVEAELFGHARGAYTGATMDRGGILEQVDGGTLFLDEIGDINNKVQSLLLRVIQEGEFSRIGESRIRKVDIRFITATNKNLHQAIDEGIFREDLFFRLVEVELQMPALRERFEDLPALTAHFVAKHHPHRKPRFDRHFFEHLRGYHWPGNVRELESYLRKLLVKWSSQNLFTDENALPFLRGKRRELKGDHSLETFTNEYRKQLIKSRLEQFGWNRTRTAENLGISRQQLSNLIGKYRLQKDAPQESSL